MKFALGYFYQVRFFTSNMIPVSTALSDPKWYHQNKGPQYTFFDKNNVINGLRCQELAPGPLCMGLCNGDRETNHCNPENCQFLQVYRLQLESNFNIEQFLIRSKNIAEKIKEVSFYEEEPIIVLLVHESNNNPCSERKPLLDYFNSHGIEMHELVF